MSGFLYYIPKPGTFQPADLTAAGLAYAFEGRPATRTCSHGPDGGQGVILAQPGPDDSQVGYYPDRQTWRRIPSSSAWVGLYPDSRPGPADVLRRQTLDGHLVRLADGNQWLVPIARGIAEEGDGIAWYPALPQRMDLDDEGKWQANGPLPKYEELWKLALIWWDAFRGVEVTDEGATVEFPGGNLFDAAVIALGANYRLGRVEVAMLGLLDSQSPARVLNALIDWPTLEAALQKKMDQPPAISSGDGGPADSTSDIDPQ